MDGSPRAARYGQVEAGVHPPVTTTGHAARRPLSLSAPGAFIAERREGMFVEDVAAHRRVPGGAVLGVRVDGERGRGRRHGIVVDIVVGRVSSETACGDTAGGGPRSMDAAGALAQASVPAAPDGPPDLDAFWATTIAQLRQVPVDLCRSPRPAPSNGTVAHDLAFRSWGGHLLRGYAITWDDRVPRPLVARARLPVAGRPPASSGSARASGSTGGHDVPGEPWRRSGHARLGPVRRALARAGPSRRTGRVRAT